MKSQKLASFPVLLLVAAMAFGCTPKASDDKLSLDPKQIAAEHARVWKEKNESGLSALQSDDMNKAETDLLTALKEAEACGKEDPRVGVTLMNIASLYEKQKIYDKAIAHLQSARKILRKAYGDDSEIVAVTEHHEATVLSKQNKWSESIPLYEESLKVLKAKKAGSYDETKQEYDQACTHVVPLKTSGGAK